MAAFCREYEVVHARWRGWAELRNGDLVAAAEREGFDVLITGDKNLRYQQNLKGRRLSIVTLNFRLITLIDIAPLAPAVLRALDGLPEGAFVTIGEESLPRDQDEGLWVYKSRSRRRAAWIRPSLNSPAMWPSPNFSRRVQTAR